MKRESQSSSQSMDPVCSPLLEAMKVIVVAITMGMCQHEEQICRAVFDDPKWPEKVVHRRRLRH